ncbi:hypothetical protein HDV00_009602 [Rhizophlyctis rosea]|nr:hypothetical protein HDV00_009602 [Rhizophlyctis rosea]
MAVDESLTELLRQLRPDKDLEIDAREHVLHVWTKRLQSIVPGCSLALQESSATGLFLPDGDVDMMVMDSYGIDKMHEKHRSYLETEEQKKGLKPYRDALKESPLADVISDYVPVEATTALAKFVDKDSGIPIDLVYGEPKQELINRLRSYSNIPHYEDLVIILKLLLRVNALSDASAQGVGGVSVAIWVAAYLQRFHDRGTYHVPSLGACFLDFLHVYSRFDFNRLGIAVSRTGEFVKSKAPAYEKQWSTPFSVRCPVSHNYCISKPTKRVEAVTATFTRVLNSLRESYRERKQNLLEGVLDIPKGMLGTRDSLVKLVVGDDGAAGDGDDDEVDVLEGLGSGLVGDDEVGWDGVEFGDGGRDSLVDGQGGQVDLTKRRIVVGSFELPDEKRRRMGGAGLIGGMVGNGTVDSKDSPLVSDVEMVERANGEAVAEDVKSGDRNGKGKAIE